MASTRLIRAFLKPKKIDGNIFWWPEDFGITYTKNNKSIGMSPIMTDCYAKFNFQGQITGNQTKIHTFNAQAGDIAEVTISQANNYVFFNVIQDLNYSSALFVGMSELNPNHWEGILPKKGKYSVIVYQVGDA